MTDISDTPRENGRHSRRRRALVRLVACVFGIGLAWYLVTGVRNARESARQSACRGRFAYLQLALRNYHEHYGTFPPAWVADADGKPMHSWRVLLLPFADGSDIYRDYRFDEPWNSPHNQQLAARSRNGRYHCPSNHRPDNDTHTDYVVIVGPDTAFPGDRTTSLSDFRDGAENSILIVEIANSDIHWMEPRDLAVDGMSFRVNDPSRPGISSPHPSGPGVEFADRIRPIRLSENVPPETLKALTTIAGGEPVTRETLTRKDDPTNTSD